MTTAVKGRNADFGPEDYDAIERAVMETPRGRWFLAERDKRLRTAETQRILDALKKLEGALASAPPPATAAGTELTSASAETFAQSLSTKSMKYFKQDEAIFTPAEPAAPKLAVVETETPAQKPKAMLPPKSEDAVDRGARLIVNRIAPVDSQPAAAAAAPQTPAAPAESADKRRIVIIRRSVAEPLEVPLQAEPAASLSP